MRKTFPCLLCLVVLLLTACNQQKVYDQYSPTPITGWEKNDGATFNVPKVTQGGSYTPEIGLRISGTYPFMGLTLIVEQNIIPGNRVRRDTLTCDLINKDGTLLGKGVNYYQYQFSLPALELHENDSLHVYIRHDMKREILPGISDVGYKLNRD